MMKKINRYFGEHKRIFLAISTFLLLSGCVWRYTRFADLGVNLFAGAIQLLFTFIVVDHLVSRQRELRDFPRRLTAYSDACTWFNRIIVFYQTAFRKATGKPSPVKIDEIFAQNFFNQILRLDIETDSPGLETWEHWIPRQAQEFTDTGWKIIERDGERIPAEVCHAIHGLVSGPFFALHRYLPKILEINARFIPATKTIRPRLWAHNSTIPSGDELAALRTIHNWLMDFYSQNSKTVPKLVRAMI
jgi:hypothetical protein